MGNKSESENKLIRRKLENKNYLEIPTGTLRGEVKIPPSKSITHRAFIIAALTGEEVLVKNPLFSEDTLLTLRALAEMGYDFERVPEGIRFSGKQKKSDTPIHIQVGNSGTTARLITAVAAIQNREVIVDGTPRMRERPISPLLNALQALGLKINSPTNSLPVHIYPGKILGKEVQVDTSQSSQYLSALLLIAPLLADGLRIIPEGKFVSRHYVDLTIAMLKKAGIAVREENGVFEISPGQHWELDEITVEGDYSSAAYFLVGAHISGGQVLLRNLRPDSVQGDQEIIQIMRQAGAHCDWNGEVLQLKSGRQIKNLDLNLRNTPDLVPTLTVMALFAELPSTFRQVEHLHVKESDRIQAITENIRSMGAEAIEAQNNLTIIPQTLKGGVTIRTFNDHRIAMSFAIAGLKLSGIKIENPQCVSKSYPDFWNDLLSLIR